MGLAFRVTATDGCARAGLLTTPHGVIPTPAFMPVATLGAVKGATPQELEAAGAAVMLANLYHLALAPGVAAIAELGGIHRWSGWSGPIVTDSGGFQVFSLARLREVDGDGVTFRSHRDGAKLRFTPEQVVADQQRLGVDIAMPLDECAPWPVGREEAGAALERTQLWARRSREAWRDHRGSLFGILQGSIYPELRERGAADLVGLGFDGHAIGGVSVGEPLAVRRRVVEQTAPLLPAERPRYLMGVGTPADIAHAVRHGIDLFDCVLPTRNARHGVLFTRQGVLRIKNARYRRDPEPVDPACPCPACARVSRAFLHHLIRAGELTGAVLATLHNLRFYLDFAARLREATAAGRLAEMAADALSGYAMDGTPETPSVEAGAARDLLS
jgi:queuine tRNA-ribosyltransferase